MATRKKKKVAKKNLKTRVAVVLDRSSSMDSIRDATISAFNEQVDAIRETSEDMDTRVSLVTFATQADDPTIWNEPVSKLKKLTRTSYRPNGMTAMYDAVGLTIDKLKGLPEADDENCSFLVVIVSDGMENHSRLYTSALIAERVKELQDSERWTFTYLGANQDLSQVAKDTGIHLGNFMSYQATADGVFRASTVNVNATRNYMESRAVGQTSTESFFRPQTTRKRKKVADTSDDSVTVSLTTTEE